METGDVGKTDSPCFFMKRDKKNRELRNYCQKQIWHNSEKSIRLRKPAYPISADLLK